ncbi:MAG: biotin/lipoyl-binding protein [Draconibacterium sp.]
MYKIKKNHLQPTGNLLPVLGLILVVLFSCTLKSGEQNTSGNEPLPAEPNRVEVVALERGDFYREIVSNGKLAAIEKAGLYFQNSGTIEAVNVRNGQTVQTGAELARLQNDDFLFNMKKAEVALEKAEIDWLDALNRM